CRQRQTRAHRSLADPGHRVRCITGRHPHGWTTSDRTTRITNWRKARLAADPARRSRHEIEHMAQSRRRQPMLRTFHIHGGYQVLVEEGGEEIGAVRRVAKDHVVIYIEGAGDFTLEGPEIAAVHDGKVRLDPERLEPSLLAAARAAHDHETE